MRVRDLPPGDPQLAVVHRDLLTPAFPPDELVSPAELESGLTTGTTVVTVISDDTDTPVAVAVGDFSPTSQVLLLSYLAVRPGQRSQGLGGRLLAEVTGAWQERFRPCLILAEVAHPAAHPADDWQGDPTARLRFYARYGARALDLPFFQPALAAGKNRLYGFLLLVLACRPPCRGARPDTVAPDPLRQFLTSYFLATEGRWPDDQAAVALGRALERPDGIPLLPLTDPTGLPLSVHPTPA